MRRFLIVVLASGLLAACNSDEPDDSDTPAETPVAENSEPAPAAANIEMTTIGDLGVDLPMPIPPEIPAPADAAYIGESTTSTPYVAAQFSTAMSPEDLTAELQAFATESEARFDESIGQVSWIWENDGTRYNVYAWVRTNEGATILEAGSVAIPE